MFNRDSSKQIGEYQVLRKMGAGGMARVFLAVHQDVPNLKVVLKILTDPRLGERFRGEADKLALLNGHPRICQIRHFFHHEDDTVIVMEHIDGITLEELVKQRKKLPVDEALKIMRDVLDTLAFAHQKRIFHRDIKPSNIMLDASGEVKIIDFGVAKAETDPNLTVAGSACGTPAYMAPEQFAGGEGVNYALADIYAVGATMFTLLTGKTAYQQENAFDIRDAKLFQGTPGVRSTNPDIPMEVEQAILTAMAREPTMRFQSAEEMRAEIDRLRGVSAEEPVAKPVTPSPEQYGRTIEVPSQVPPVPTPTPQPGRTWKERLGGTIPPRLRLPLAASAGAMVLIIIGWLIFGGGPSMGTIAYAISPSGHLYVDGDLVDQSVSSGRFEIESGRHIVRAVNWRSEEGELVDTVDLAGGGTKNLSFTFTMPPPGGLLRVSIDPEGDVYLDRVLLAEKTSFESIECDTGRHILTVRNADSQEKEQEDTLVIGPYEQIDRTFEFATLSTESVEPPDQEKPDQPPVDIPTVTYGKVRIGTIIGTKVVQGDIYLDGVLVNKPPGYTIELETGEHRIHAKKDVDGVPYEADTTIVVRKGQTHKVTLYLTAN